MTAEREPLEELPVATPPAWLPRGGPAGRPAAVRSLRAKGEEMVRRLLDVGRVAFQTRSYEAARVDDIVDIAGASHGTFYLYFRNKEDLLHRLAIEASQELRGLTLDLEALPAPPTLRALTAWVDRFVDAYARHGQVIRVWLDRRDLDPLMQAMADDVLGPLAEAFGRLVDPATADAVGAGVASLSMLSLLERFTSYLEASDSHLDRDAVVRTQARLLHGAMVGGRATMAGRRAR